MRTEIADFKSLIALVLLPLLVFAQGGVDRLSDVTLTLAAGGRGGSRESVDLPVTADACLKGALSFDMTVSDPSAVSRYVCYVRCGKGWYCTSFEPTRDETQANKVYSVTLSTADIVKVEGLPEGWRTADRIRFAVYRMSSKPCVVKIANLAFKSVAKDVLFVRNSTQSDPDDVYLGNLRKSFAALDIPTRALDQKDLVDGALDGVKLVVLPYAPSLSDACQDALEAFVAKGGKIFAAYNTPARIARLVGLESCCAPNGLFRPRKSSLAGFVKGPAPLAGQPDFAPQASWICSRMRPLPEAKVAAWWQMRDGRTTDIPGVVVSPHGIYVSHVWLGTDEDPSLALFAAAVETVLPGTRARYERVRVAAEARAAKRRAELAAMPGRSDERRLLWCHSAWGMSTERDWDATCRFAKENGFTDLLVNLAWGGCAFYPSKVLPRAEQGPRGDALTTCLAACRKYGLKLHAWKVCWNQGAKASSSFRTELQKAGRCCVSRKGKAESTWNCPSHPANRQLEIDAMVELALEKGVDGIHFDYIRYKGEDFCFCDGCRARFEKRLGRRVDCWPQDVAKGGPLNDAWTRFRCGNIAAVVKAVAEKVKKVRPETEISAAVFPLFETIGAERGQDWLAWCRAGWLDFVCPMDYIDRAERFAACIHAQREALKGTSVKFYPGLAFECAGYGRIGAWVPAQEILEVRKAGLGGFAVFHLGPYAEESLPLLRKGPLK